MPLQVRDEIATAAAFLTFAESGGGPLVRWQGANTGAGLLAAALDVDEYEGTELTWTHPGGGLVLMDAAEDGRAEELMEPACRFELPAGTYVLSRLYWEGEAAHPDGTVEELMVAAIRLTRS